MKLSYKAIILLLLFAATTVFAIAQTSLLGRCRKYTFTFINGSCTDVHDSFTVSPVLPWPTLTKVSPTITDTYVNVKLQSDTIDAQNLIGKSYYVVSLDGLVQQTGTINKVPESIDFSGLKEGQYLLIIGDEEYQEEFKIIRK